MISPVRATTFSIFVTALLSVFALGQLPFQLKENFISGLDSPVFITNAGDGMRRLFIVQQRGIIKVAQAGSSTTSNYLNISSVVSSSGSERGLLGLAFHPNFAANRRFFVYYTRQSDGAIEIAEYAQNAINPNVADPSPVKIIITIAHPTFPNHNGGTVAFGPDGYLYAGTGDGGSANDPNANSQNLNSLLGKMLRLDIDNVSPPFNYSVPQTNPFAGATPGADEIFAYGLRNPYRFSFDRGGAHQLWVGDVGQDAIEEVDVIVNGGNYGWRAYEGTQCTGNDPPLCSNGASPITQVPPVFQYTRVLDTSGQNRCSVTGGRVYRGKQNALPVGSYVYADYCTGEIMLWNGSQQTILRDTTNLNLVAIGEDENGELYVVRQHDNFAPNSGSIARIIGNRTNADFDGDGGSDLSLFRPSQAEWYSFSPVTGAGGGLAFGLSSDVPVPADYDGDGKTDFAVFRPSDGTWYAFRSSDFSVQFGFWGLSGDIPVPDDFTGDRKADLVVYRPSEGRWYVQTSDTGQVYSVPWGTSEDLPVSSDFDGDGKADIVVWRPSSAEWWFINSSNSEAGSLQFGVPGDVPARGDFDGDGKTDVAVYRPSEGVWYIFRSSDLQVLGIPWGIAEDVPVPGDYDRDGLDDIAVWRPSSGTWWIIKSSDHTNLALSYGSMGDIPLADRDTP